ncbi:MAG: alpha-glucosidase [Ruminococcaceae bacterium]|jgi:alpha-glucosidase|nr:alpha-glucosidase [Oscillospiraceae bacterium]
MLALNSDKKSLNIIFENENVLSFLKKEPLMWLGSGEDGFSMSRGSFKFKEKVLSKTALYYESHEVSGGNIILHLVSKKDETKVSVTVKTEGSILKLIPAVETEGSFNRMWFRIPATETEHVYGCGEIFTKFDLRGEKVRIWVAEHQNGMRIAKKIIRNTLTGQHPHRIGKFLNYESYYAQPTFMSSRKYFVHVDSDAYMDFCFNQTEYHELVVRDVAPVYFGFANTFEALSGVLSSLLGRQPLLPEWAYDGTILGIQGGTETMFRKIETAEQAGVKVTGVWCQDWEGERITAFGKQLMWNWVWDKELYPDLDKAIEQLHARGIKFLGYINPFLAIEKELYKEATEKGYCVKDANGEDYLVKITTFPAAMIDLTNPDAYEWIKNIIKTNMIGLGLDGWMADFSEYLPTDCVLYNGMDAKDIHNTWPALWAKANREALEETGKLGQVLFFTRAGHTNTVKYSTLMWNGDQHVDFSFDDGLPSVIPATLSLAVSGFGLCHSDIGGYTTFGKMRRNEELFMRWSELNVFTPLFRGHEGNQPDSNTQFDKSDMVLSHYAKMSRLHYGLKNYLMALDKENNQFGVPVIRPLFYYYGKEKDFTETYEFLLGRDLLVAPVLEEGDDKRSVYLPDDEWINLWNGYELVGGTYNVDAPIGQPPVFCRKSSPYLEQFKALFDSEKN